MAEPIERSLVGATPVPAGDDAGASDPAVRLRPVEPVADEATPLEKPERSPEHERAQLLLDRLRRGLEAREAELNYREQQSSGMIQGILDFVRGLRQEREQERAKAKAVRELYSHVLQVAGDLQAEPTAAAKHLSYIEQLYNRAVVEHEIGTVQLFGSALQERLDDYGRPRIDSPATAVKVAQDDAQLRLTGAAEAAETYVQKEVDPVSVEAAPKRTEAELKRLRNLFANLDLLGAFHQDLSKITSQRAQEPDPAKKAELQREEQAGRRDLDTAYDRTVTGSVLRLHGTNYQFGDRIGMGGMGMVSAATDLGTGREVALKVSKPTDRKEIYADTPEGRHMRRTINEIAALHRLSNERTTQEVKAADGTSKEVRRKRPLERRPGWPPVAMLIDAQMIPNPDQPNVRLSVVAIERVAGRDLQKVMASKENPLTVASAQSLGRQLIGAVQFMHERGVYHRDLKNGNVMVTDDGELRIIDLGIALIPELLRSQIGPSEKMSRRYAEPALEAAVAAPAEEPATLAEKKDSQQLPYAVDRTAFTGTFIYMPDEELSPASVTYHARLMETALQSGDRFRQQRQAIVDRYRPEFTAINQSLRAQRLSQGEAQRRQAELNAALRQEMNALLQSDETKAAMQAAENVTTAVTEQARRRDLYGTGIILYRLAETAMRGPASEVSDPAKRDQIKLLQFIACRFIRDNEQKGTAPTITLEQANQLLSDLEDPAKRQRMSTFLNGSSTTAWLVEMQRHIASKRERVNKNMAAWSRPAVAAK